MVVVPWTATAKCQCHSALPCKMSSKTHRNSEAVVLALPWRSLRAGQPGACPQGALRQLPQGPLLGSGTPSSGTCWATASSTPTGRRVGGAAQDGRARVHHAHAPDRAPCPAGCRAPSTSAGCCSPSPWTRRGGQRGDARRPPGPAPPPHLRQHLRPRVLGKDPETLAPGLHSPRRSTAPRSQMNEKVHLLSI